MVVERDIPLRPRGDRRVLGGAARSLRGEIDGLPALHRVEVERAAGERRRMGLLGELALATERFRRKVHGLLGCGHPAITVRAPFGARAVELRLGGLERLAPPSIGDHRLIAPEGVVGHHRRLAAPAFELGRARREPRLPRSVL